LWTVTDFHIHGRVPSGPAEVGGVDSALRHSTSRHFRDLAGRNEHAINAQFSFGVTVGFAPRQVLRRMSQPATPAEMRAPGF
jgi:hypothetical protein